MTRNGNNRSALNGSCDSSPLCIGVLVLGIVKSKYSAGELFAAADCLLGNYDLLSSLSVTDNYKILVCIKLDRTVFFGNGLVGRSDLALFNSEINGAFNHFIGPAAGSNYVTRLGKGVVAVA